VGVEPHVSLPVEASFSLWDVVRGERYITTPHAARALNIDSCAGVVVAHVLT